MKNYLDDKSKLIERIKTFRRLKAASLYRFIDSVTECYEVARLIDLHSRSKAVKNQAKKNFIINMVSCLEVLLKEIIVENRGNWNRDGLDSLLKEKITLLDAFDLFKDYRPAKEDLLSISASFQNLQSIETVFDKLTKKNFLYEVGQYSYEFTDEQKRLFAKSDTLVFNRDIPGWKKLLMQIYEHRHTFVHESTYKKEIDIDVSRIMLMVLQLGPAFWATVVHKKF